MDILTLEKSKLEVLQSSSLVLLPNSITIEPHPPADIDSQEDSMTTKRISLSIRYADTIISVLVTMENPLDFIVTTPNIFPMKYLDDKGFPPNFPQTRLVELLKWLINHLKAHMTERLSDGNKLGSLATALDNMVGMDFIKEDSYELMVLDSKATLLVKFRPGEDIKLASVNEMVKEDKLINSGGHFFVLKMVFKVDTGTFLPGEFAICFSSDLTYMLPEVAKFNHPGLSDKLATTNLVEFLMYVKESVDKTISDAVAGWERRSRLLLLVYSIFEDGEQALVYLDYNTMTIVELAFRSASDKHMLKMELSPNYPAVPPKLTWFHQSIPEEGARETRGSGEIKERVISEKDFPVTQEMDEKDIAEKLLDIISRISKAGQ